MHYRYCSWQNLIVSCADHLYNRIGNIGSNKCFCETIFLPMSECLQWNHSNKSSLTRNKTNIHLTALTLVVNNYFHRLCNKRKLKSKNKAIVTISIQISNATVDRCNSMVFKLVRWIRSKVYRDENLI